MRRSAAVFTALVLLLTAAVAAPFFVGADPDLLMIVVPLGMFAPFVAALATWMLVAGRRPAFGEAFATRRFGPGLLLALGVFVAIAALQPVIGTALGIAEWRSPADPVGVGLALVAQFAIMLVASIGEELGWRGWLFTLLRPRGFWFTALVTTAIWTVWHLPIVAINVVQGFDSIGGAALALASVAAVGPLFAALPAAGGKRQILCLRQAGRIQKFANLRLGAAVKYGTGHQHAFFQPADKTSDVFLRCFFQKFIKVGRRIRLF